MPVPGNIESGLEAFRRTVAPPVIDGERYLARQQASYDSGNAMFARWKPGYLLLTPTRLLFYQGETRLFEVALADVRSVEVLTRRWLTRKSCEQLVVTYQTRRGPRSVCLRTEDLEEWRESIQENIPEETETETTETSERLTCISHQPGTSQNSVPLLRQKQCRENFGENTASGEAVAHRGEKCGLTVQTTDYGEPDTGQRSGILPAASRRDEAESTLKSFHLATPWAGYEAWRGIFDHTSGRKRNQV